MLGALLLGGAALDLARAPDVPSIEAADAVIGSRPAISPGSDAPAWVRLRRAWIGARSERRGARWTGTLSEIVSALRREARAESAYGEALAQWSPSGSGVGPAELRGAVLDALGSGRTALAHALLDGPLAGDRDLLPLRAQALGSRGRPDSGLALLGWPPDRRPGSGPGIVRRAEERASARDEAALLVAGALADSARMKRAGRAARWALLAADPSPLARREARLHLARSLLADGQPRLALAVIEPEAGSGADAALLAAEARAGAGDTVGAIVRLTSFASPRGVPTADRHAAAKRAVEWIRNGRADSIPEGAWLDLMRALGDLGEAESALPLFAARRFVSLDSAATLERAETGASLLARARRHDAASAGYAALLRRVELPAAVRARFALGLARARRGAGDFAGADSAFILAAVLDSEGPSGEQAAWERAREWEDRKTPLEAATTYAWARPRIRSGSLAAAARIHGALAWLRAGGLDSARALLASPRPESGGLQFWLGQVALAGGDTAASRAAYRAAWRLAPWTYEGIRAAEELKAEGAWPPDSAPFKLELPPRPSPATGGDAPLRARLLEALGLKALGLESFRECARSAGKGGAASCADALEERGQFRAVRPADNGVSGTRWEYPPAYALEVFAAAERESLDPALLWAIMRQESGYNRAVRSRAGALGLLQLLPGTASMLAGRRVPEDSLTVAEVNVRLGARYVRDLMEEMHDPRAVLAAYNAGEDAVRRWLRERGPVNDRWVESIPYRETRDYVKQVYAAWRRYEALYGTLSR